MQTSAATAPSTEAVCAEHPQQTSTGTCGRCGRFVCESCSVIDGNCASCRRRQLAELPSSELRALWTRRLLGAGAVLAGLKALVSLWLYSRLEDGLPNSADASIYDRLVALLSVPAFLVLLVTAVLYLRWLHLAVKTTKALGLGNEEPSWAVWCWFIPFANLVRPYHVVRDLWSSLQGGDYSGSLLMGWWTAWLLRNISGRVETTLFEGAMKTPSWFSSALLVSSLAEVLDLAAAVLCIIVVREIQHLLNARKAEVTVAH